MPTLLLGAVFSWLLLRALIPHLRRHLLDQPNDRSSHSVPTPSGGGLGFVLVTTLASILSLSLNGWSVTAAVSITVLPLSVVGFLDDLYILPATWRYGVQLATAFVLIILSPLQISWLLLPLLLIAVTSVINFINFMDGLDGLVAACMVLAISSSALVLGSSWSIWALVGSLLGFLPWNWSPAKVFMGDVGSTFLGAVFVALVLQAPSWSQALALLLVATPLLADACLCVPRRLIAGNQIFSAHRLHLFQRLHQAGWSHSKVSTVYISATLFLSIALLYGGLGWVIGIAAVELLIGVWLDQRVAVPFESTSSIC